MVSSSDFFQYIPIHSIGNIFTTKKVKVNLDVTCVCMKLMSINLDYQDSALCFYETIFPKSPRHFNRFLCELSKSHINVSNIS